MKTLERRRITGIFLVIQKDNLGFDYLTAAVVF